MAEPFNETDPVRKTYFINESERDEATPANDEGKVPQLEEDGQLHPHFTRSGLTLLAGETLNGATLPVPVYQDQNDGELYACDANDTGKYKFIGFVTSNSTDGNNINFQGSGVVSGFSGLTEGASYYVQDASGTIGTTPGTHSIHVGVAVSPTQLFILKGKQRSAGNGGSLGSSSGSLVVTCGFRPSLIRINAMAVRGISDTPISIMNAVWANEELTAASATTDDTSPTAGNATSLYGPADTTDAMSFTITSVTNTGFTVTWTEIGTFVADAAAFHWEAEGDL